MSARGRVFALVALAAVVTSGVVVVGVLATRGHVPSAPKPRAGRPPITLYSGVRLDPESQALDRGQQLYAHKHIAQAAQIFDRYHSLEAQVAAAIAAWPDGTLARLEELASEHPRNSLVGLHLGLALYWSRRDSEALAAWRAAAQAQPDTPYAVRAADFLHPQYAPGLPRFVPSFPRPLQIRILPPAQQLAALRRAARGGGAHAKLLYGTALQQLGRPVSAQLQFAAAARLAPDDPDARVAAAVGLFDKAKPARAFGTLGPLTRVFPRAQTVRFHLGLLLLWSAQLTEARKQLALARNEAPGTVLGKEAAAFLQKLAGIGTG
jgi:tetratricopeptide (TPR) repeat protein